MTFATDITGIWGSRGSGKTTLSRNLLKAAALPCVIAIDPVGSDTTTLAEVDAALLRRDPVIRFCSSTRDEQIAAVLMAYGYSTPANPIYALCDEAPAYLDKRTEALSKVMFQGRHAGFGMCLIGQRATALDAQLRSQIVTTYWMRLTDAVDVQAAASQLGAERARGLSSLGVGEHIRHPE